MKNSLIILTLGIFLLVGCNDSSEEGVLQEQQENITLDLRFDVTKAPGANYPDGTSFGFIAYESSNTEPFMGDYGWGSYYYNANYRAFVPCKIGADGVRINNYDKDVAMRLKSASTSPIYNFYMYTPGVPMENSGGSLRIYYKRNIPLQVTNTYMQQMVVNYYKVYDFTSNLSKVKMKDIFSKFCFEFVQGTSSRIYITNASLLNVGTDGYYHPLMEICDVKGQEGSSEAITLTNNNNSTQNSISYYTATDKDIVLFPTDYTMESLLDLVLKFDLKIGTGTVRTMQVPISMNVNASTRYTIKVTVTTQFITVTYSTLSWETGISNTSNPDAVGSTTTTLVGTYSIDAWETGGTNTETIG